MFTIFITHAVFQLYHAQFPSSYLQNIHTPFSSPSLPSEVSSTAMTTTTLTTNDVFSNSTCTTCRQFHCQRSNLRTTSCGKSIGATPHYLGAKPMVSQRFPSRITTHNCQTVRSAPKSSLLSPSESYPLPNLPMSFIKIPGIAEAELQSHESDPTNVNGSDAEFKENSGGIENGMDIDLL